MREKDAELDPFGFRTTGSGADYELRYSERWANELVERGSYQTHVGDDTISIWADCPRCRHQLSDVVFLEKAPERKNYTVRGTVLSCNCQSKHEPRAEGTAGCGAYAGFDVEIGDGSKNDLQLKPTVATSEDRRWDQLSYKAGTESFAASRELAGKWSATVATLLSILGVASILGLFDQLLKLPSPLRVFTAVLTVAAVTAAALGTYRAAQAAQGTMTWMDEVTGRTLRTRIKNELAAMDTKLRHSRRWTALAVALTVLIVFLVVVREPEPPATMKLLIVSDRLAEPACGTPAPGQAGHLTLQPEAEDADPIRVDADDIATVSTVEQCP